MLEENDTHWQKKKNIQIQTGVYDMNIWDWKYAGVCWLLWAATLMCVSLRTRPSGLQNWPARTRVFISWLPMGRLLTLTTWPQQYQSDHLEILAVRTVVHFSLWGYWTIYMPVTVHRLQTFPTQTIGGSSYLRTLWFQFSSVHTLKTLRHQQL